MTGGEKAALVVGGVAGAGLLAYVGYRLITSGPPTINGRSFSAWVIECGGLMKTQGYTYSNRAQDQNLPCVRVINYMLATIGYSRSPYNVSGRSADFSSNTESAIKAFQAAQGLASTGIVDYATFMALIQAYDAATKQG